MSFSIDTRLTPIGELNRELPDLHHLASPLGLLSALPGTWEGHGFNTIFRPMHPATAPGGSDNFLELNLTNEKMTFTEIPGEIPNRGFAQGDISLFGLTYLQEVSDANVKGSDGKPAGLHVEPGIWINIPATTNPNVPATVARLATIPHGTSLLAQGTVTVVNGPPQIPDVEITPDFIGTNNEVTFPSQTLSNPANGLRSPDADIVGVTQEMVSNPNVVLQNALAGKTITSHVRIDVTTKTGEAPAPAAGGGISDIAFLDAGTDGGPNAKVTEMKYTAWISNFVASDGSRGTMLQYSQTVVLRFAPLDWPHISVANLFKHPDPKAPLKEVVDHKHLIIDNKPVLVDKNLAHEVQIPNIPIPIPDPGPLAAGIGPGGPAGPAEIAGAGHFIPGHLRPRVGDVGDVAKHAEEPDQ